MELFSQDNDYSNAPLAYRMSPRSLDEYIGQDHIVGEGRLLRRVIQADRVSSLIFYGPPGTGKTSLARVIANTTQSAFTTLNAVLTGVKDLREQIDKARERRELYETRTILFVDEVHRWNKAQQDALLPWVENGTVILIGATTHNPYFEVNSALVSRSRIFQLTPLTKEDLRAVAHQALEDPIRGYGNFRVEFEEGALEHLIDVASGDARSLLNALELAVETTPESFPPRHGESIHISFEAAEESIQKKAVLYDKEGDYHFDVISAFIKSIRGSDPDATLYWLAKMVHAGEDPRFIFRRMLISAGEDIGIADPHAISVVESSAAAFDRVGMPEGRYHLAHAALYLATTDKSNSSLGFFDALETVKQEQSDEVPRHLKDANRDKQSFGHGEGYLYPHAYRDHWVAQQYLPGNLQGRVFYRPSSLGYEGRIKERVDSRREANLAAMIGDESPEVLTYSPPDKERERWIARVADKRSAGLLELREAVFELLMPARHHRILDLKADDGLFLWEALRRAPEGGVAGLVENEEHRDHLRRYAQALDLSERPELIVADVKNLNPEVLDPADYGSADSKPTPVPRPFERIVGRNCSTRVREKGPLLESISGLLTEGGIAVLAEAVPRRSPRLSEVCDTGAMPQELAGLLLEAERILYEESDLDLLAWDGEDLAEAARAEGFEGVDLRYHRMEEQRIIRAEHIRRWFSLDTPQGAERNLAGAVWEAAGETESAAGSGGAGEMVEALTNELIGRLADRSIRWHTEYALLRFSL